MIEKCEVTAPCSEWKCPDCDGSLETVAEITVPDKRKGGVVSRLHMQCFECNYECIDYRRNGELVKSTVIRSKGKNVGK